MQLVGVTALYIAAKLDDKNSRGLDYFVHVTAGTSTRRQVQRMEQVMIKTLEFRLLTPTSIDFLHIFYFELYKTNFINDRFYSTFV